MSASMQEYESWTDKVMQEVAVVELFPCHISGADTSDMFGTSKFDSNVALVAAIAALYGGMQLLDHRTKYMRWMRSKGWVEPEAELGRLLRAHVDVMILVPYVAMIPFVENDDICLAIAEAMTSSPQRSTCVERMHNDKNLMTSTRSSPTDGAASINASLASPHRRLPEFQDSWLPGAELLIA